MNIVSPSYPSASRRFKNNAGVGKSVNGSSDGVPCASSLLSSSFHGQEDCSNSSCYDLLEVDGNSGKVSPITTTTISGTTSGMATPVTRTSAFGNEEDNLDGSLAFPPLATPTTANTSSALSATSALSAANHIGGGMNNLSAALMSATPPLASTSSSATSAFLRSNRHSAGGKSGPSLHMSQMSQMVSPDVLSSSSNFSSTYRSHGSLESNRQHPSKLTSSHLNSTNYVNNANAANTTISPNYLNPPNISFQPGNSIAFCPILSEESFSPPTTTSTTNLSTMGGVGINKWGDSLGTSRVASTTAATSSSIVKGGSSFHGVSSLSSSSSRLTPPVRFNLEGPATHSMQSPMQSIPSTTPATTAVSWKSLTSSMKQSHPPSSAQPPQAPLRRTTTDEEFDDDEKSEVSLLDYGDSAHQDDCSDDEDDDDLDDDISTSGSVSDVEVEDQNDPTTTNTTCGDLELFDSMYTSYTHDSVKDADDEEYTNNDDNDDNSSCDGVETTMMKLTNHSDASSSSRHSRDSLSQQLQQQQQHMHHLVKLQSYDNDNDDIIEEEVEGDEDDEEDEEQLRKRLHLKMLEQFQQDNPVYSDDEAMYEYEETNHDEDHFTTCVKPDGTQGLADDSLPSYLNCKYPPMPADRMARKQRSFCRRYGEGHNSLLKSAVMAAMESHDDDCDDENGKNNPFSFRNRRNSIHSSNSGTVSIQSLQDSLRHSNYHDGYSSRKRARRAIRTNSSSNNNRIVTPEDAAEINNINSMMETWCMGNKLTGTPASSGSNHFPSATGPNALTHGSSNFNTTNSHQTRTSASSSSSLFPLQHVTAFTNSNTSFLPTTNSPRSRRSNDHSRSYNSNYGNTNNLNGSNHNHNDFVRGPLVRRVSRKKSYEGRISDDFDSDDFTDDDF